MSLSLQLNAILRKCVALKQRVMAKNIKFRDAAKTEKDQRSAQHAINRNEKSISLLITKLLCSHEVEPQYFQRFQTLRCPKCTTNIRLNYER